MAAEWPLAPPWSRILPKQYRPHLHDVGDASLAGYRIIMIIGAVVAGNVHSARVSVFNKVMNMVTTSSYKCFTALFPPYPCSQHHWQHCPQCLLHYQLIDLSSHQHKQPQSINLQNYSVSIFYLKQLRPKHWQKGQ